MNRTAKKTCNEGDPTWQDQDVLDSVIVVLRPLQDFVDLLGGEERVTISAVLPLLSHIKEKVLTHKEGDSPELLMILTPVTMITKYVYCNYVCFWILVLS